MYKKVLLTSVCLLAMLFAVPSCTNGDDPATKIQKVSMAIRIGTSAATSIGFVAIPNEVEADEIAIIAIGVLEDSILPLLAGDEAGIIEGLERLLDLSVFDNPKLEKLRLIVETALPLLSGNLPDDLLDKQLTKLPEDVKAYLSAFFNGLYDGLNNYLGPQGERDRGIGRYHDLRKKLAA